MKKKEREKTKIMRNDRVPKGNDDLNEAYT